MTPKEKAKELIKKFYQPIFDIDLGINVSKDEKRYNSAKESALIAVDEILNNNCGSHTDESNAMNEEIYCDEYYWQEVKTEIKKL